jgi:hypothetical protein
MDIRFPEKEFSIFNKHLVNSLRRLFTKHVLMMLITFDRRDMAASVSHVGVDRLDISAERLISRYGTMTLRLGWSVGITSSRKFNRPLKHMFNKTWGDFVVAEANRIYLETP